DADFHRPRGKLDLLELLAPHVAPQGAALPAEQVEEAVVVEVAPDSRAADTADLGEALAFFVAPDLAADAQVHPAVVAEVPPGRDAAVVALQPHRLGDIDKEFLGLARWPKRGEERQRQQKDRRAANTLAGTGSQE